MDAKEGGLTCCSAWGCRELDITWQLHNSNNKGRKKKERRREREGGKHNLSCSSHSTVASNKISFALPHYLYLVPVHRPWHTSLPTQGEHFRTCLSIESTYYPANWKGGCSCNRHIVIFFSALNRTQTWTQLLSLKDSVKTKIHFQWLLPFLSCQTCDTFMSWMHNTEIYIG